MALILSWSHDTGDRRTGGEEAGMAETRRNAKLGTLDEYLVQFSQKMPHQEATEPRGPAKVIQLPLWPEPKRGAPNAVLRGALFAAIQGKGRQYMLRKELVSTQDGVTIRYTGAQLDQADLDVWEQALHLARTQALGTECYFTAHGFLKALGRATGKQNHEWLKAAFARLAATAVEITSGRRTYFGSLIDGGVRDEGHRPVCCGDQPQAGQVLWPFRVDPARLGSAATATRQAPGLMAAWLLCQPRQALPADRGLPAQAQRQPDQAAKAFQAEPDPSTRGSRSRGGAPGV